MIVPVIIAGGKGQRLWPASRDALPKPFVALSSPRTLFQETLERLAPLTGVAAPLIVCNELHRPMAEAQAKECGISGIELLLEPEGRNTAPAICAAALAVRKHHGEDAIMLVMPSDHRVSGAEPFAAAVRSAADLASKGRLVTFAITPRWPATGYGYLKIGEPIDKAKQQFALEAFVEKPDLQRAEQFLASGLYAWNSGMFAFRVRDLLSAFNEFEPGILAACDKALPMEQRSSITRLESKAFAEAKSISIDYAIMERSKTVATVVASFDWSDVGDWNAVWDEGAKDSGGNVSHGDVLAIDCSNSLVESSGPLLVALGLADLVAVATKDAVLVAPRARAQDVRKAVDEISRRKRREAAAATIEHHIWGTVERIREDEDFAIRKFEILGGHGIPAMDHAVAATWICLRGQATVIEAGQKTAISPGKAFALPAGATIEASDGNVGFLEIVNRR